MNAKMKFRQMLLTAAMAIPALLLSAGPAQANPTWGGTGLHQEFFNNFENLWRPIDLCTPVNPCYVPNFDGPNNDPVGWARPIANGIAVNNPAGGLVLPLLGPGPLHNNDAFVTGVPNLLPGADVFAGILNIQEIRNVGVPTWFSAANNQFTGYFAQLVTGFTLGEGGPGVDHVSLGPVSGGIGGDPWGKLAPQEIMRLYEQTGAGTTVFESNGSITDDITKATDGNFWASLGITAALNPLVDPSQATLTTGYTYSHVALTIPLANFSQQDTYLGLNLIDISGTYNKGLLLPINDPNEGEQGGIGQPPLTGTCLPGIPGAMGFVTCNHFVGTGELEGNPDSILFAGFSPWFFASNDPMINYIPEPSALALTGLGLLAMGGLRRRWRRT